MVNWHDKYKHTLPTLKPNKKLLKASNMYLNDIDVEEFNKIYQYCLKHYTMVPATRSKGLSNKIKYRYKERFTVINGNQAFELIVNCLEGDYRFVLKNKPGKDNTVKGRKACIELFKVADKYDIDFSKYEQGTKELKEEILAPHIQFLLPERFLCKELHDVHHIDLNSAYASKIVEAYPELKEMYDEIYSKRKDNNGFYKHVLTNSIGCFQSEYCVDYHSRYKSKPYAFSNLSKIAVNGTREAIEALVIKLKKSGRTPILTNTDGIWYSGKLYHDKNEGTGLSQWKHDHKDCTLLVRSKGAYQYLENGKCKSVVRGTSNLDAIMERDDWKFGDIINKPVTVEKWQFITGEGVKKVWQSI